MAAFGNATQKKVAGKSMMMLALLAHSRKITAVGKLQRFLLTLKLACGRTQFISKVAVTTSKSTSPLEQNAKCNEFPNKHNIKSLKQS